MASNMIAALLLSAPILTIAQSCPYAGTGLSMPEHHPRWLSSTNQVPGKNAGIESLDIDAVKVDIKAMFNNSQPFWPADFGNYGPFMIRQAWHCAGSYRSSDGRGGCDGGRQRFLPELAWDDNTNLDKAKTLLWPIKQKYGQALSWGDLIILTGTTAIESMGGPTFGFCAGRIDDIDGKESEPLGEELPVLTPCGAQDGNCTLPFGTTTIGLIYVNPEGPMGIADPVGSAAQVRDTFKRMSMDDAETVALIGGGHAFGKTHGACSAGAGPSPAIDPSNPWPGLCKNGTFTSGFEGTWVTTPTQFSNQYFYNLLNYNWTTTISPGNKTQWHVANGSLPGVMMLTSDISLIHDSSYLSLVNAYANNLTLFSETFARAWYKLTTRDMGPVSRCVGKYVPPPQPFQYPLPPPPPADILPNWEDVRQKIKTAMYTSHDVILSGDTLTGPSSSSSYYGALFLSLSYHSAATFRQTDYQGGVNGARIRFPPQSTWSINKDMKPLIEILLPLKEQYGDGLTWADLIVFAGQVALEDAIASSSSASSSSSTPIKLEFCAGRSDALADSETPSLSPILDYSASLSEFTQRAELMGLTKRQMVALSARIRSPAQLNRLGYPNSTYTKQINILSNQYFKTLLNNNWKEYNQSTGVKAYQSTSDSSIFMTPSDLVIRNDPVLKAIAQEYAEDNNVFLQDFAQAWQLLMNADRFDGPSGNLCSSSTPSNGNSSNSSFDLHQPWIAGLFAAAIASAVLALLFLCCLCRSKNSQASDSDLTRPLNRDRPQHHTV